jgi:hypothetical protein
MNKKSAYGRVYFFLCIWFAGLLLFGSTCGGETTGGAELSTSIDVLIAAQQDILAHIRQVEEIRTHLGEKEEAFGKEIRETVSAKGAPLSDGASYEAALKCARVSHNLDIMARIRGYDMQLTDRADALHNVLAEVEFILKEAEDSRQIIEALRFTNLSELMERVEKVMSVYRSVMGSRLIPPSRMPIPEKRKVWDVLFTHGASDAQKK